ncbi:MAG: hypothetical protein NT027_00415 [Proteobacteria bacterium]|nr:hypothetical protein [Pseudomonadota bacterium]
MKHMKIALLAFCTSLVAACSNEHSQSNSENLKSSHSTTGGPACQPIGDRMAEFAISGDSNSLAKKIYDVLSTGYAQGGNEISKENDVYVLSGEGIYGQTNFVETISCTKSEERFSCDVKNAAQCIPSNAYFTAYSNANAKTGIGAKLTSLISRNNVGFVKASSTLPAIGSFAANMMYRPETFSFGETASKLTLTCETSFLPTFGDRCKKVGRGICHYQVTGFEYGGSTCSFDGLN